MFQRWEHLLFLHWQIEPEVLQATLPKGLRMDTYDGKAWLAIVPFRMSGVRPRSLPALPWISNFLELNVRTYVTDEAGHPGVWFYSLDCNQPIAVEVARTFFKLDYFHARMRMQQNPDGQGWEYVSRRIDRRSILPQDGSGRYIYSSTGPEREAEPGSLEFFLIERYRLFSLDGKGTIHSGRVWHPPYRITAAEATAWDPGVIDADSLPLPTHPPDHICYSPGVKVEIFPLQT